MSAMADQKSSPSAVLSDTQLAQWRDEGYLLLRDVVPAAQVAAMRSVFEAHVQTMLEQLLAEGAISDLKAGLPFESRFHEAAGKHAGRFGRSWRKQIQSRALYDLHHVPAIADGLHQIFGRDVLGHPVWNARPKLPSQQLTVVPWHQDSGYFGKVSAGSNIVTAWLPLTEVTADNGGLQVIPGSHKAGLVEHRQETREGAFLEVATEVDESKAVTCLMSPGDVLLFGNLTYHRSLPGGSLPIRWSVDLRFYPAGDHMGDIKWPDERFEWVIRSDDRPPTPFEVFDKAASGLPW